MEARETSAPFVLVAAVFLEALAAVLAFAPAGSLALPAGAATGFVRAAIFLGVVVVTTVIVRTALPGPKAASIFWRAGGSSFPRTLYYGLLAAVVLTFFRAAWVVALNYAGTPFVVTLAAERPAGPFGVFTPIVLSVAACYFFYGYLQGLVGGALGRRAGLLAAATLAALAVVWPLTASTRQVGEYSWQLFLAWRLPEAFALAWLAERTRNLLAPLVAIFLTAWFTAMGVRIFVLFGMWPFLFGCLVILLATAEILIAERRRLGRAAGGFFGLVFGYEATSSLVDGLLLAAALAGAYTLVRTSHALAGKVYVGAAVAGVIFAGAVALWFVARRWTRKPDAGVNG